MKMYIQAESGTKKKNTDLAAILVTYWRRAWRRRATGDQAIFRTSVVASSSMLVHSFPGTPA